MLDIYKDLNELAALCHTAKDEQVRQACWRCVPNLLRQTEQTLAKTLVAHIAFESVAVSIGNPATRQGATCVTLSAHEEIGNRCWLSVELLPEHGRIIVCLINEPVSIERQAAYRKLLENVEPGVWDFELAKLLP